MKCCRSSSRPRANTPSPGAGKGVKIVASKLADDAGITGGAVLARRELK